MSTCGRCHGRGYHPRPGDTCYRCEGTGGRPVPVTEKVPLGDPPEGVPSASQARSSGVPPRRAPDAISHDPHGHAERIRQSLGYLPSCGRPDDIYDSEFRRTAGFHPIHECQLRELAARQLAEFRAIENLIEGKAA